MKRFISLTLIFLFLSNPLWAKDFFLKGNYEDYYGGVHTAFDQMQAGDRIHFADGEIIHIEKIIGKGGSTTVAQTREYPGKAVRFNYQDPVMGAYERWYMEGYRELYERGVEVNPIRMYRPGKYFVVDLLPDDALPFSYLLDLRKKNPYLALEMENKLIDFARSVASFADLADVHTGQMIYSPNEKKWIVYDWLAESPNAFKIDYARMKAVEVDMNPFENFFSEYQKRDPKTGGQKIYGEHAEYLERLKERLMAAVNSERWRMVRTLNLIKDGMINEDALRKRVFVPVSDCAKNFSHLSR